MAALTSDKNRLKRGQRPPSQVYPVAANAVIHYGAIVCLNASGYLVPGADTAGLRCVGVAEEAADNTGGADGDLEVLVFRGVAKVSTSGASAIAQADVGTDAVILDDDTVITAAGATNDIVAGEVMEVASDGVWVNFAGLR